jgi:hypothetical protein
MDSDRSGIPYELALEHLIGLMAQGWAAQASKAGKSTEDEI